MILIVFLFCTGVGITLGQNETSCGSVIETEFPGTISYKVGVPYGQNERCVFTIRIPRSSGFNFELVESGISEDAPNDGLSLSIFGLNNPPLRSTQFMKTKGVITMTGGNMVIITFMTSNSTGTGFTLNYNFQGTSPGISLQSRDFIHEVINNGTQDYPDHGGNYADNEVSSFIFAPPQFNLNAESRIRVTWTKYSMEGGCQDQVFMYRFYPDARDGWSWFESYCPASPRTTSHTDMILMVFRTDGSVVGRGFRFDWEQMLE